MALTPFGLFTRKDSTSRYHKETAAVQYSDPANRRFGSRVRISLGGRGAPYRRTDPKPDLNSTLKRSKELALSSLNPGTG